MKHTVTLPFHRVHCILEAEQCDPAKDKNDQILKAAERSLQFSRGPMRVKGTEVWSSEKKLSWEVFLRAEFVELA